MILFWGAITVAMLALEAGTMGLVSIWFAIGSAAALIAAALRAGVLLQILIFIVVSAVSIAAIRPFARRCLKVRPKATNADRVLGVICQVTEDIDNITGTGAVQTGGKEWTARSLTGVNIPAGEYVRVASIQGVKLIVEPAREPAAET